MMPAGTYWIGDLCYVMHERWDEFCALTIVDDKCLDGEFVFADGVRFATYGTKYGDGGYTDQFGHDYGVDAGLIGCVLLSDIDKNNEHNHLGDGHVVTFLEDFYTSGGRATDKNWNGVIRFGNIRIATGDEDE